jgi:hypothetical protein
MELSGTKCCVGGVPYGDVFGCLIYEHNFDGEGMKNV